MKRKRQEEAATAEPKKATGKSSLHSLESESGFKPKDRPIPRSEPNEPEKDTSDSDYEDDNAEDPFERHFADSVADTIDSWIAKEQEGQFETETSTSSRLGNIVKNRIATAWNTKHSKKNARTNFPLYGDPAGLSLSPLQAELFPWISSYQDILVGDRQDSWTEDLRDILALHTLNHVFRTRDKILANNSKISAAASSKKELQIEFRDQTFVRPKVLVLLPFRSSAHAFVRSLIAFSGSAQQENKGRFEDEYGDGEDKRFGPDKSDSFRRLFSGNSDDNFRLGLKVTRKAIKLYSDFFSSDIIVASPLGLRTISEKSRSKDELGDVLSSVEILLVDQCDVFLMQNWEHIQHVFSKLNGIPKESHGCDFSRVKRWSLDGKSHYLRQTILFSSINSPDINALTRKYCHNVSGNIRVAQTYQGIDRSSPALVPQIFRRFECSRPAEESDLRFNFFIETILPSLRVSSASGLLIFASTYFEFVRLRNYFVKSEIGFAALSEYTESADVNRNRAKFASGEHAILLMTERVHFFRRYRIKGVKRIVFYSLPQYPEFYSDVLRLASPEHGGTSTGLFCKLDRLKLERIVGSARAADWASQQKNTFS